MGTLLPEERERRQAGADKGPGTSLCRGNEDMVGYGSMEVEACS